MIPLTYSLTQLALNGRSESTLEITVLFDREEKNVDRILSVRVFNWENDSHADVTAIMFEHFEEQLNSMVDSINWWELCREKEENEREVA